MNVLRGISHCCWRYQTIEWRASVLELLKRELNYQLSFTMCSAWLLLLFLDILAWLHTLHHTKYLYMKLIRVLRFCFKGSSYLKITFGKKYGFFNELILSCWKLQVLMGIGKNNLNVCRYVRPNSPSSLTDRLWINRQLISWFLDFICLHFY